VNFENLRGHSAAVELLSGAVRSGRVAHAYAFVGPSGIGRKVAALAFARALLCRDGGCGKCAACGKAERLTHPDLHLIIPDGQHVKIEQIREVERLAALAPYEGRMKVFIIDDAERMTLPTANALLKTLEEPPDRTLLILIVSHIRALPATVLSRCQVVRFNPLPEDDAVALLAERGVEEKGARLLARVCQGRVGLALGASPAAWVEERDLALSILTDVTAKGAETLFKKVESLGRDQARVERIIETYWLWYRDLLCVKGGANAKVIVNADRQAELEARAAASSWEEIFRGLAQCREAWQAIRGNVSPRLTLEVTLASLALRAA
jgi:DNA polymerase-3 subunit delta'